MGLLEVPYFSQERDYTCGPASLRMVLAFYGRAVAEEMLAPLLGTNDVMGTERDRMSEIIKHHQLVPYERTDATLEDLRHMINNRMPVIVRHLDDEEDSDHYSVVVGVDETHVTLNDPWFGANRKHELSDFLIHWPCTYEKGQTCWMLGVGDRELI